MACAVWCVPTLYFPLRYRYYRLNASKHAIPIRWMAPEVLRDSLCSAASERWSYAVLLWEVFSLGTRPYPSMENREVLPYILSGMRLEMPPRCPPAVFVLMLKCWSIDCRDRPNFHELVATLKQLLAPF